MRYFPEIHTEARSLDFYRRIGQELADHGYGLYAAEEKRSGDLMGFIGFHRAEFQADFCPCIQIGWRLAKRFWNRGYATEGAKACLAYGFERLSFERVYSFTAITNLPSQDWLTVICLAVTGFIFVTTELMPIGLLPDIAHAMGKSEAYTGLLITVYAQAVALTSLPLTLSCRRFNRRPLILIIMVCFTLSQVAAALAPNFAVLMGARIMTSLCHALFWALAPPLAVRMAPQHASTKALSLLATVTALGSILGMPIGAMIGHQFGWRFTFALVGLISFGFGLALYKFLPSAPGTGGRKRGAAAFQPWCDPGLQKLYALITLLTVSHPDVASSIFSRSSTSAWGREP